MASDTVGDVVAGEDLDVILELLESEFLDEEIEIQDAFEEAVVEIEDSEICCEICGKKCRSKGGLTRHKNTKHKVAATQEADSFSIADYCQLVSQCVESLSQDECYPEDVRKGFQEYVFVYSPQDHDLESIEKFARIKNLYKSLERKGNVEQFYSSYFALVPLKAAEYFAGLPFQSSVLLATRLADKIVSFFKEGKADHTPRVASRSNLSVKEKSALQYLGGYVLFSLNKRLRKSPKWKSVSGQQAIALLRAGKQGENSSTEQHLVDCLNRGGLWKISSEVEQIFTVTEIHFKNMTSGSHIVRIDKDEIVSKLIKNHQIVNLFGQWVSHAELEVPDNVSKDILYQSLLLYTKVRSFSFAKDVISRYKARKKTHAKSKSLRKELKRKTDTSEHHE